MSEVVAAQPAQAPVVDPNAQVAEVKQDDLAPRFASLANKEKQIRIQAKEAADRMKQAIELENKYKEDSRKFSKEEIRKNPAAYLASIDMTMEEYIEASLAAADGKPLESDVREELKAMQAKLDKVEADREAREKAETEKAEKMAVDHYKGQIEAYVKADLDTYELINAYTAFDDIYDVIEEYYNANGEMLDPDPTINVQKAAEQVETYLFDYVNKGRSAKKFAPKVEAQVTPFEDPNLKPQQPKPFSPMTPTPTITSKAATATSSAPRQEVSDIERKRRAAAMIKFN
jgi:hypothetical protein